MHCITEIPAGVLETNSGALPSNGIAGHRSSRSLPILCLHQVLRHLEVDGIRGLWAVQGDVRHRILDVEFEGLKVALHD